MRGLVKSILTSLWFMALTFPIMAIKVNASTTPATVQFELHKVVYVGLGSFLLSFIWRFMLARKGDITPEDADMAWLFQLLKNTRWRQAMVAGLFFLAGLAILAYLVFAGSAENIFSAAWLGDNTFPLACALLAFGAGVVYLGGRQQAIGQFTRGLAAPGRGRNAALALVFLLFAAVPFLGDSYQLNVLTFALLWVVLGLGLNIVVGQTGLLVLGYVAFYAIGAYTYAILNSHYGLGFWAVFPVAGLLAAVFGLALGFPVLRLRGDYLAIVTLGFGEIVRLVLENWTELSQGAKGIDKIPPPGFFGLQLTPDQNNLYMYYLAFLLVILTIFAVRRLRDSRLGRSWMALREDEIACEAMGIDKTFAKLSAFALGACWAGFSGVLFAAKTAYVHPASFTFMESAIILSVVVLGGLGSTLGVILGAFVIVLLPESLRSFAEYRMLIFGASMVLMMVFRPQGLLKPERKIWKINDPDAEPGSPSGAGSSGSPAAASAQTNVKGAA